MFILAVIVETLQSRIFTIWRKPRFCGPEVTQYIMWGVLIACDNFRLTRLDLRRS